MSNFTFRPAKRRNTPLIVGLGGATKSGKTMSGLRLAKGMAKGGKVVMLNTEGARGHCYADQFSYVACDLTAPFRPSQYTEALKAVSAEKPAVVIVDSVSHMHDGPGGILEMHEEVLDRMAGNDYKKRERCTFAAWIEPKRDENAFIYQLLSMEVPVILCMRAKEKIKLVKGGDPIDLGWQPIVGDRVAFETIFTLMLPPHSQGTPDLSISDMRTPFDKMVAGQIDEKLGERLTAWAQGAADAHRPNGGAEKPTTPVTPPPVAHADGFASERELNRLRAIMKGKGHSESDLIDFLGASGVESPREIPAAIFEQAVEWAKS